jgi:hypothetical protein
MDLTSIEGAATGYPQHGDAGVNSTAYARTAEEEERGLLTRLNPDPVPGAGLRGGIVYDPVPPLYNEAQLIFDGIHYCRLYLMAV